ncbi:hypothetical protein VAEU17_4420029 [Vibrio aestuarianus]|nr:hypothetical protein VAEU17_4420029 [Vibrio aestuarianus]
MMLSTMLYLTNPEKQMKNTVESKTRTKSKTRFAPEYALSGFSNSIIVIQL